MRKRDEPTWVYSKRCGWLVDECPVFRDGHGKPWVITGRYVGWSMSKGQIDVGGYKPSATPSTFNAPFWDGWDMSGSPSSWFRPLTAAARDLLASLHSEAASLDGMPKEGP